MARQWRIEFGGAFYHIMSRGNDRQSVFLDDHDRRTFVCLLEEFCDKFLIEVYAYVLMDNHYHLLIQTRVPSLSQAMQWLGTTYTRRFNNRHHRHGHLFQGRFKSIVVENEAYILQASYYIHRNPLRAGRVDRLSDYPWSSYHYYAYKRNAPLWLNRDLILSQFNDSDPHKAYRLKVQDYSDEENRLWENIKHGLIYGSETFVKNIKANFLNDRPQDELPQHNLVFFDFKPQDFFKKAADLLAFDINEIRQKPRLYGNQKDERDVLIYFLWKHARLGNQKLGELFGMTYSAVSKCVANFRIRLSRNKALRKKLDFINSQFKV